MLMMKPRHYTLLGAIAALSTFAPPVSARCPLGFTGEAGYNYCVPTNPSDRKIWLDCANEQRRLGLTEVSPCISESRRIKLIDKYIYYCRKSKLPHLMRWLAYPKCWGNPNPNIVEATHPAPTAFPFRVMCSVQPPCDGIRLPNCNRNNGINKMPV